MRIFNICCFVVLSCFTLTVAFAKNSHEATPGRLTYEFSNGKIQCMSEIDENDHIYVSIVPMKENTTVNFSGIESPSRNPVLVATMSVKEDTGICGNWTNLQEVKIALNDPLKVTTTTLKGNVVYNKGNITVFAPKT